MAKRKPSTNEKPSGIPVESVLADPRKVIAMAGQRPRPMPTDDDLGRVAHRLQDVGYTLVAIHRMTVHAIDNEDAEYVLGLMREASRSAMRAVDACICKLQGGGPAMGNFADDLALD